MVFNGGIFKTLQRTVLSTWLGRTAELRTGKLRWNRLVVIGLAILLVLTVVLRHGSLPRAAWESGRQALLSLDLTADLVDQSIGFDEDRIRDTFVEIYEYEAPTTPICRFHRACVTHDGQLALSEEMAVFHKEIMNRCGLENSEKWPGGPLYGLRQVGGQVEVARMDHDDFITFEANFVRQTDLLSTVLSPVSEHELPSHIPNFVYQLVPWLFAAERLRVSLLKDSITKSKTTFPQSHPNMSPELIPTLRLRPSMFKELQGSRKRIWTVSFLKRMNSIGFVLEPVPSARLSCYRSIVVQRNTIKTLPVGQFSAGEFSKRALADLQIKANDRKWISIGIFQRANRRTRRFANAQELKTALSRFFGSKKVQNKVEIFSMENGTSFEFQVKKMQSLDVLISSYGAGMANALFMRPGTFVIEVVPFGEPGNHGHFANASGVHHTALYAKPDTVSVEKCIDQLTKVDGDSSGEGVRLKASFSRWTNLEPQFGDRLTPRDFNGPMVREDLHTWTGLGRKCIRDHQLLSVDISALLRILLHGFQAGSIPVEKKLIDALKRIPNPPVPPQ